MIEIQRALDLPQHLQNILVRLKKCTLRRVLARMRMPFRDTWWICPGGLKRKPSDISKLRERTNVCLGLEDPRDLSTGSRGGGSLL